MTDNAKRPLGAVSKIRNFFVQTFRLHTGAEYSEFLTRGVKKREERANRQYPWVYLRLFATLFVLLAVFLLIIRFTGNELFAPTVFLLAALAFNLPFLVLLYELCPNTDLSLISVAAALLIGGTCADVLVQILFSLFPAADDWLLAVYSGFFEELSKGAVVLVIIIALKTKDPYAGFMMGVAVGCGFSVVEDMGYVFVLSNQLPAVNLHTIISVSLTRGLTAFCTHALWSGAVGWAYVFFERHFANVCFYLMLLLSCGLHICWDLPLVGWTYYLTVAACVVVVAAVDIPVIAVTRVKAYRGFASSCAETGGESSESGDAPPEQVAPTEQDAPPDQDAVFAERPRKSAWYSHAGHVCLAVCAFLMAVVSVVYCSIPFRETYYSQEFSSPEELVSFMQDGYDGLYADWNRVFDPDAPTEYTVTGDETEKATQEVVKDGFTYDYVYNVVEFGGERHYSLTEIKVKIRKDGVYSMYYAENLYDSGELYATFFRVRGDVIGFIFSRGDEVTAVTYNPGFVMDLTQPQYAVLFYVFAALAGTGIAFYIGFKIKARSVKKYEG